MNSVESEPTNYRYSVVANTVVPAISSNTYTDLARFVEAASTGAVIDLFSPTASPPEHTVAALVASGVQHISLIVYEDWPGLWFEPELLPMLNGDWKLALYTAEQWDECLEHGTFIQNPRTGELPEDIDNILDRVRRELMPWRLYGSSAAGLEYQANTKHDVDLPRLASEMSQKLGRTDDVLLSYIDDLGSFAIPHPFWAALLECVDGIGLHLYIAPIGGVLGKWAGAVTPQTDTYAIWRCGSTVLAEGSVLDEVAERATQQLCRLDPPKQQHVYLERFSRDGRFNIYLARDAIEILARYEVTVSCS